MKTKDVGFVFVARRAQVLATPSTFKFAKKTLVHFADASRLKRSISRRKLDAQCLLFSLAAYNMSHLLFGDLGKLL